MKNLYKIFGLIGTSAALLFAFAATASAATLTLSPSSKNVNVGDTLTVSVLLDTAGAAIDGVDIQTLNYNPYFLQLQDADGSASGVQISAGTLMANTLANSADTTNGKISFSQVTNGGTTYTGSGTLATMTFKVITAGTAKLTFDFAPGATTDSNVASQGNDILSSVTNAQFTISGSVSITPGTPTIAIPQQPPSSVLRLINDNGTYYLVSNGYLLGITNPGMLTTYGFKFSDAKAATADDRALPKGPLLTPADGALVKSKEDPTVYLISSQQRYGFTAASVFLGLGFKFSSVLVVTNPELQALARASNLDNPSAGHLAGLDINRNGTVYWVGYDNELHPYSSAAIYNSWHVANDYSRVVPANTADFTLPVGSLIVPRALQ